MVIDNLTSVQQTLPHGRGCYIGATGPQLRWAAVILLLCARVSFTMNWPKALDEIRTLREQKLKRGVRTLWYRGQPHANWPLLSRLHRKVDCCVQKLEEMQQTSDRASLLLELELTLYSKFRSAATLMLEPAEMDPWGILCAMQHHGAPTRLLDWTASLVCGVYFAQYKRQPTSDAAIYLLDPEGLNARNHGKRALFALLPENSNVDWLLDYHPACRRGSPLPSRVEETVATKSVGVTPALSNRRMLAQRAAFVICSDRFDGLEAELQTSDEDWLIKKVVLSSETYDETESFLQDVGIGHFHYFPDLPGLAEELEMSIAAELMDRKRFPGPSPP